ncbi:MAG: hypothetical protein IJS34_00315 [Alphaproteobacteria bacterium]|nr:hypothetical protein [Alphaproteobacteria bacterium]
MAKITKKPEIWRNSPYFHTKNCKKRRISAGLQWFFTVVTLSCPVFLGVFVVV